MSRYILRCRPGDTLALEEGGKAYGDGDSIVLPPDRVRAISAQSPAYRFEPAPERTPPSAVADPAPAPKADPPSGGTVA